MILLFLISFAWAQTEIKYRYNYDGDTITFDKGKVRVLGIDTPEMKSKRPCESAYGKVAKAFVEEKMKKATKITMTNFNKKDIYGRILADVQLDGVSLADMLLSEHLAVPYVRKKWQKVNWCKVQEKRNESKKL